MGYDRDIISNQLEHFSAERLAALAIEWADDKVMTYLIEEALELYHGILPSQEFRPRPEQLEALGFPVAHQGGLAQIGYHQATDREEAEATRMVLWWAGTHQYQLRKRPSAQAQWSTIYATWSTEENFTGLFAHFFASTPCPTK
jgi:hypothetical protein